MSSRFHGGLSGSERQELTADPTMLLDLSVSLNAYGPSSVLRQALQEIRLNEYPDPECLVARQALARQFDVVPERIALGNGASELLWSLANLLGGVGKTLLLCEPCFSETRAAFVARGTKTVTWRASPEDDFDFDAPEVTRLAQSTKADVIYLCAPSSPAGRRVPVEQIWQLARDVAPAVILLDQAFLSLSDHADELHAEIPSNVIAVRSLTKELGLPAIRVGYLIAAKEYVEALETHRSRWTVSSHAQVAARISCREVDFLALARAKILAQARNLRCLLEEHGFAVVPSNTGYCLARGPLPAPRLRALLLKNHAIVVRDCSSFGLADYIRLGVKDAAAHERLAAALEAEFPRSAQPSPQWSLR